MKFEIVEQSRAEPLADPDVDPENLLTENSHPDDPIQGLKSGTARLLAGVRAEAQQIGECVAEMADLAALSARARLRRHDRPPPTRPPAGFRAARFHTGRASEPHPSGARPRRTETES
jgi:hypothetical protein